VKKYDENHHFIQKEEFFFLQKQKGEVFWVFVVQENREGTCFTAAVNYTAVGNRIFAFDIVSFAGSSKRGKTTKELPGLQRHLNCLF